ncbi:unnamed protein product [Dibothriocephalus latus]|uniref:Uncharacterized protein n=1 Tax=Dibothriocephalus latus TaxID=60516 RepID=A0A3P7RGR4_DIBLA|nr:unnamed protein product [Dibothriocephalus latus]
MPSINAKNNQAHDEPLVHQEQKKNQTSWDRIAVDKDLSQSVGYFPMPLDVGTARCRDLALQLQLSIPLVFPPRGRC